jgi:cysteine synthase
MQRMPVRACCAFAVSTSEAVECAKRMATVEGMMVGPSSGAALKYALDVACRPEAAGTTIVVLASSHAIRYTEHPMWAALKDEAAKALPTPPPPHTMEENVLRPAWDSANQPP